MVKIGVLVSGGGTNLQAVIDGIEKKQIPGEIVTVVSNNPEAYALKRAQRHGIHHCVIQKQQDYEELLLAHFREKQVDLILLAGFMVVLGPSFIAAYENRIMNVHPSLIPSFCGKGFYGIKVHEKALEKGVKVAGATVHFVDNGTDTGPIILQKAVPVQEDDTPERLQKRVMEEAEWVIFPEAVRLFCEGKLKVEGQIVRRV